MSWDRRDNHRMQRRKDGPPQGKRGKREPRHTTPFPEAGIPLLDAPGEDPEALPSLAEAMAWDGWLESGTPPRLTMEQERELREAGLPSERELSWWSRLMRRDIEAF